MRIKPASKASKSEASESEASESEASENDASESEDIWQYSYVNTCLSVVCGLYTVAGRLGLAEYVSTTIC